MNILTTFFSIQWQHLFKNIDFSEITFNILKKLVIIIVLTIGLAITKKIGKLIIKKVFKDYEAKYQNTVTKKRITTFYSLALNVLTYCLWFLWIYTVLSTIGIPVGTLVASAGIFSLAIGLGAQGFVTDIVSGFFILLEHQIEVGEYVEINAIKGTVTAVGLRTTQIVADDGTLNFVPNRTITTIANRSRNNMVAMIKIGILPDTPINQLIEIINETNNKEVPNYPDIINTPQLIGVVHLENNKLAFQVNITTKNGSQGAISRAFLKLYLSALAKHNINLQSVPRTI